MNSLSENKNSQTQSPHIPTVVIVGRPNVGKSSLFNAIVGRRMSIVHEMSGVTRDRVVAQLVQDKCRFNLVDTGGLTIFSGEKRGIDMWDSHIASQVDVAVSGADVLILVANVQDGIVNLDEEVASSVRASGKPVLFAVNKCDNSILESNLAEFMQLGFKQIFPISSLHKRGIKELMSAVRKLLPQNEPSQSEIDEEKAEPVKIAVVGRPNVGKSSLVNALLGEERMMVSDVSGTTRDAVDSEFTLSYKGVNYPAILVDTAGLRKRSRVDTVVEYFSVMRAQSAIERADMVLLIVEASPDGMTAQDRRIAGIIEKAQKPCIVVANKFDLYQSEFKMRALEEELRYSLPGMNHAPVVFISAKDHSNFDMLLGAIVQLMQQMKQSITTGMLNRVLADAFAKRTPPVVGNAPLKFYYATMIGSNPPQALLFVNDPKYCADNYLAFLKNYLRQTFDLTGMPLELILRARPKKVQSFHRESSPTGRTRAKSSRSKSSSKRK